MKTPNNGNVFDRQNASFVVSKQPNEHTHAQSTTSSSALPLQPKAPIHRKSQSPISASPLFAASYPTQTSNPRKPISFLFPTRSQKFSLARKLLKPDILRYPFRDIASRALDECGSVEAKVVARLFNSMITVATRSRSMKRLLTLHLLNLKRSDEVELANDFFRLMVASELGVASVYSLTVVVSALCCNGEIKTGRELVEEVETIKPNIVTFKSMIDCCVKRWNFEELGLVLELMGKESVSLDLDAYKILIDGFASYGKVEEAEKLVSTMHDKQLKVETYLYNLIINGYARLGLVEKAVEIHSVMSSRGVVSNKDTYWGLVNGLCRAGKVCEAMRLTAELRVSEFEVDEAMYRTLIEGCYRAGTVDNALERFVGYKERKCVKGRMPELEELYRKDTTRQDNKARWAEKSTLLRGAAEPGAFSQRAIDQKHSCVAPRDRRFKPSSRAVIVPYTGRAVNSSGLEG
uniref:Pentacotripeptide-repeat region of PRORP domain-containing protein n=1 Tax=Brassica oleracea var. oleracea TaxID=109376 RepID=A0A0D3BUA6_BRAOL